MYWVYAVCQSTKYIVYLLNKHKKKKKKKKAEKIWIKVVKVLGNFL